MVTLSKGFRPNCIKINITKAYGKGMDASLFMADTDTTNTTVKFI